MKNRPILLILPLLALASGNVCSAADTSSHETTINVSAGFLQFDDTDDLRDSLVYDLRLGYDILGRTPGSSLGIEAGASYVNGKSEGDSKTAKGYLFRVDATYPLSSPRNRTVPFLALGAGARLIDKENSSTSSALFAYGAGVKYFITNSVALRLDWRHNLVYDNVGTLNNFQYLAGLSYVLHSDKPVQRIPVPRPAPKGQKKTPVPSLPDTTQAEKAQELPPPSQSPAIPR